eukprot:tig00021795_g23542.t1
MVPFDLQAPPVTSVARKRTAGDLSDPSGSAGPGTPASEDGALGSLLEGFALQVDAASASVDGGAPQPPQTYEEAWAYLNSEEHAALGLQISDILAALPKWASEVAAESVLARQRQRRKKKKQRGPRQPPEAAGGGGGGGAQEGAGAGRGPSLIWRTSSRAARRRDDDAALLAAAALRRASAPAPPAPAPPARPTPRHPPFAGSSPAPRGGALALAPSGLPWGRPWAGWPPPLPPALTLPPAPPPPGQAHPLPSPQRPPAPRPAPGASGPAGPAAAGGPSGWSVAGREGAEAGERQRRAARSFVWGYFRRERAGPGGREVARCTLCPDAVLSFSGSTSSLSYHSATSTAAPSFSPGPRYRPRPRPVI